MPNARLFLSGSERIVSASIFGKSRYADGVSILVVMSSSTKLKAKSCMCRKIGGKPEAAVLISCCRINICRAMIIKYMYGWLYRAAA